MIEKQFAATNQPSRTLKRSRHDNAAADDTDRKIREVLSSKRPLLSPIVCDHEIHQTIRDETMIWLNPDVRQSVRIPAMTNNRTYDTLSGESDSFCKNEMLKNLQCSSPFQTSNWNDETLWTRLKNRLCQRPSSFRRFACRGLGHCATCGTRARWSTTCSSSSNSSGSMNTTTSGNTGSSSSTSSFEQDHDDAIVDVHTASVGAKLWKIGALVSISVAILAILRSRQYYSSMEDYRMPEWEWDRNVFIPTSKAFNRNNNPQPTQLRISLIAQVAADKSMKRLSDVSSRPNRAYARQWKMDFVNYSAGRRTYSTKSCFDMAYVLHTVADKQREDPKEPRTIWPSPRVHYDSILLLPSDAIVMELDQNILEQILPHEKLVAVSGWVNSDQILDASFGVVMFNMGHKYATTVAKLWWEMTQDSLLTCGATNGVSTLIQAIASVVDDVSESLDDLIEPMMEQASGALGQQLSVKCLPSSVPGPRIKILTNSLQESSETLHQTADAVCYRFYPKCEVVP
jgi:hypothetical protein